MKPVVLACCLVFIPGIILASSDAVAPTIKIELTIADHFSEKPASIIVEYVPTGGFKRMVLVDHRELAGIDCRNSFQELEGLGKLQIDTMKLRYGVHQDGRKYHYIDTFFGDREEDSIDGFKRVWFMMQGDKFIERETFITLRTGPKSSHFKQLTHKPKGEATTVINKRSEQDGARQPTTAPDSKSEGSEKPKPESEGRSQ